MRTIRYGSEDVEVLRREWKTDKRIPYKKTYALKPGESWFDAHETVHQWEHYVLDDGVQIPVGAVIAKELKKEGAIEAAFIELWHGCVIVDETLNCVDHSGKIGRFLKEVKELNNGKLGGFPDVIGIFEDGKIALREAKNLDAKDRLSSKQHDLADLLRKTYKEKLDLKVVEWIFEK